VENLIEINLFAPFPIHLLDNSVAKKTKYKFIKDNMKHLVKVSDTTPKQHFNRFVFFRINCLFIMNAINGVTLI
jgi:hypothetical protein